MFTQDDLTKADKFAQFISKAQLNLSVSDWLLFHQHLVWYNTLITKIKDNIFEPVKVHKPEAQPAKSSKRKDN